MNPLSFEAKIQLNITYSIILIIKLIVKIVEIQNNDNSKTIITVITVIFMILTILVKELILLNSHSVVFVNNITETKLINSSTNNNT